MILLLLVVFVIMLLLGIPVAFSMLGSSLIYVIVGILNGGFLQLTTAIQRVEIAVDSFPLMAIPFFVLAGEFMNSGGITKKIMDFARVCRPFQRWHGPSRYFRKHSVRGNVRLLHRLRLYFWSDDDTGHGARRL